jgi:hypothetical protein
VRQKVPHILTINSALADNHHHWHTSPPGTDIQSNNPSLPSALAGVIKFKLITITEAENTSEFAAAPRSL